MNARREFLGGSDAAAVLGVSDWMSPVQLYHLKRGTEQPKRESARSAAAKERGRKLEPFIRDMVIDKLEEVGHQVKLLAANERYIDPEHPFLQAEIDFELEIDGVPTNVDAKSASGFLRAKWGAEWSDDVPIAYAAQFAHQMMVTGRSRTLVGALIGLDDVRLYWQPRDEQVVEGLRQREVDFWLNHVQRGVPPDPLQFPDLTELYPESVDRTVEATPQVAEHVDQLRTVRRELKRLTALDMQLCLAIGEYMRSAARLTVGGELVVQWGTEKRSRFLVEEFRAKHPGLAELFTERTSGRTFRLQRLKGRGR